MTKAKKPAEAAKKDAKKAAPKVKGTAAKTKAAAKPAVKTTAKNATKAGAKAESKAKPAKAVKAAEPKKPAKAAAKKPTRAAEPKKPAKSAKAEDKASVVVHESVKVPQPDLQFREKKIPAFANSGLAVMTASKKPALSVAPGVMILGKAVAAKTEQQEKAAERKLSKKELAEIQNSLLEKRERLLAGMRRELAVQRERAESKAADEVDKATDAYDGDLSFEIATANDQELSEIQIALEKIEKGTYGECEVCGCTISPSRLKILPSATTCVACRGQEEMSRRRDDANILFSMMNGEDGDSESNDG